MPYNNRPDAISGKPVRQWQDLPDPVLKDGVLTIVPDDAEYTFVNNISAPYPLAHPINGGRATFSAINGATWTYTGTDACFREYQADGDIETVGQVEFHAPNGLMWDCKTDGGFGSFQASQLSRFRNCVGLGKVEGPNYFFNHINGSITDFGTGLIARNTAFFEINTVFVRSSNTQTTTYFTVDGDQTDGAINFALVSISGNANQTFAYINPDVEDSTNSILIDTTQANGPWAGTFLEPGSLDQTTPKAVVEASEGLIPNSTVKGKLNITANAEVTTISAANTPTGIATDWHDGDIEERVCFRDKLTFDNTTNTCTTLFDHGLVSGDKITLVDWLFLPTGLGEDDYYIVNETAQTFQLALTPGGAVVNFTSDGTPDNYYNHKAGISRSGWMVYTGITPVDLHVDGWVSITKTGSTQLCAARIMHVGNTSGFIETPQARGSVISAHNNSDTSSQLSDIVKLQPREGIKIYLEAVDHTDNLTASNALVSIRKA